MIIRLEDPHALDVEQCGGKASTLARLVTQGFPVPPGFIVPTEVLAQFLDATGLRSDVSALCNGDLPESELNDTANNLRTRILSAQLPGNLRDAIQDAVDADEQQAGRVLYWAVRSSAVAEDTHQASFAGQYETHLGVASSQVVNAVLSCWASIFNERATHYRREQNHSDCRAAVLVQQLIDADVAGVCFTVDPVSGDRQRIVIDASYGLGESVVSGLVTPDSFVVDRESLAIQSRQIAEKDQMIKFNGGEARTVPVPGGLRPLPCLTDEQIISVAKLGLELEATQEHAVDIEWVFAHERLFLVQSRPITVAGANRADDSSTSPDWIPETNTPINPKFPLYSNGNISEVLPGCVTPLAWDHTGRIIESAFRQQLTELGAIKPGGPEWQVMGLFYHRPYICVSFLADAARQIPVMTPDTIYEEFVGKPEKKTPPFGLVDWLPHRWMAWWRALSTIIAKILSLAKEIDACTQTATREIESYSADALTTWDSQRLVQAVRCTDDLVRPSAVHVWSSTFAVVSFSMLRGLTQAWLNDDEGSLAAELVTSIDHLASAVPASAIYQLAEIVQSSPRLLAHFQSNAGDRKALDALMADNDAREFQNALHDFLNRFGHRAIGEGELGRPCWREDPSQVIALIRNDLQPGSISPETIRQRQQVVYRAAVAKLDAVNFVQRRILQVVIARTRQFIAQREHMKNLSILRSDRSRRVYSELRQRLVEQGLVSQRDDIYFLVWQEINALVDGALSAVDASKIIARRRREYTQCQLLAVPKIQKGKPRFVSPTDIRYGQQLRGIGVSPGRVQGRARIMLDPRTDAHINPGEILVAPVTDVAWTPLFLQAAGLVVEVGGLLSHGSIVAREYGLPAVVGVAGATQVINTGDLILLDGNTGTVDKLA